MVIAIYFDESKKNRQIIKTGKTFAGDVQSLVEHVTHSNLNSRYGVRKNFYSYEVL